MTNRVEFLTDDNQLWFTCPGCGIDHAVNVNQATRPCWSWNGSLDLPTFKPSIRVRWTKMTELGRKQRTEWLDTDKKPYPGFQAFDHIDMICHSFVKDGKIQFLNDCTHELAGQTVDLPDVGEE